MSIADQDAGLLSIGAVLALLKADFPDVTISKIRFLESQGLVEPIRTPSGYRKFSTDDIGKLRYILEQQTRNLLPLRVIRRHLDALGRGLEPASLGGAAPQPPTTQSVAVPADTGLPVDNGVRMSRSEFLDAAGISERELQPMESAGLIAPEPESELYSTLSLQVARIVVDLRDQGVDPRNLSPFLRTVEREVELVTTLVGPMRKSRDINVRERADHKAAAVSRLSVALQSALVRTRLAKELAD